MGPQFGFPIHDGLISDLRNLKQESSLQDYIDAFGILYPKANILESQAISFFISGFLPMLQMPIRMLKPSTLSKSYSLARFQELTVDAIRGSHKNTPTALFPKAPKHTTSTDSTPKKELKPLQVLTLL